MEIETKQLASATHSQDIGSEIQTETLVVLVSTDAWIFRGIKLIDSRPKARQDMGAKVPLHDDLEKSLATFAQVNAFAEETLGNCLTDLRAHRQGRQ